MKKRTTTPATFITLSEALKNGNNGQNQEIKSRFVGMHVYACVTNMAEYILGRSYEDNNAPFSYDDIENIYSPAENQYRYIVNLNERGEFYAHVEDLEGAEVFSINTELAADLCENHNVRDIEDKDEILTYLQSIKVLPSYATILDSNDDPETEQQEIFEYWLVSDYLCGKLREYGQPVLKDENIWGRTCSGQAILLDYVITKICADMGILEGQENSWSK